MIPAKGFSLAAVFMQKLLEEKSLITESKRLSVMEQMLCENLKRRKKQRFFSFRSFYHNIIEQITRYTDPCIVTSFINFSLVVSFEFLSSFPVMSDSSTKIMNPSLL